MSPDYKAALADFVDGFLSYQLWGRLGLQETKRRYRRTVAGPFWMTISLGIFILAAGMVWTQILRQDIRTFLPYLTAGMVVWVFLTTLINEGCNCFISGENVIKQVRFPYSMLAFALVWRDLLSFFHNALIYILVAALVGLRPTIYTLMVIPGLAILFLNGIWIATLLGLLSARFRDIRQIVSSIMQVAIFVTPIFWRPDQVRLNLKPIVDLNVLYHFVQLIRAPLLGVPMEVSSWKAIGLVTFIGWAITFAFYSRFRKRLPYWL